MHSESTLKTDLPPSAPAPVESDDADTMSASTVIIEPARRWQPIDWRELWAYRELLYFLVWRDVKIRYKQTALGAAWSIIQPFATMVVFSLFFGRLAKSPSNAVPYPLFVFAGLLPWTFFSNSVIAAAQSVVNNHGLVTKVYFPRLIIPVSAVWAGFVDFAIAFAMLLALMLFYGVYPSGGFLLLPLLSLGLIVAASGVGTLLSALTVAYRDFRYVVTFMVQLWMFATPCIYLHSNPLGDVHSTALLSLNPVYGVILNFRAAALGKPFDLPALGISCAVSLFLLMGGCLYFRRVERRFADVI